MYIFNLRGNQRTLGEQSRKEGGKIFGSGSRAPIAISILIKDGSDKHELHYHDVGDYLSRKQKLKILDHAELINGVEWQKIQPDKNNDWINQRDPNYQKYADIGNDVFYSSAVGVSTNRDAWVNGFSKEAVLKNSKYLIDNYNEALEQTPNYEKGPNLMDDTKIKWSSGLKKQFQLGHKLQFNSKDLVETLYRPFTKKYLMYDRNIVERPGQYYKKWGKNNLVIVTTGRGASRDFSVLVSNLIPDIQLLMNGQGFMRYDNSDSSDSLFQADHNNMNQAFADKLGLSLDDTFAYVYGLLNSPEYQQKYANDLKKDLARIPVVANKEKYVEVGKKLMDLHINYEEVPVYPDYC